MNFRLRVALVTMVIALACLFGYSASAATQTVMLADFTDTTAEYLPMHNTAAGNNSGKIKKSNEIAYGDAIQSGVWSVTGTKSQLIKYTAEESGVDLEAAAELNNLVLRFYSTEETDAFNVIIYNKTGDYYKHEVFVTKSGWQEAYIPISLIETKVKISEYDGITLNKGAWQIVNPNNLKDGLHAFNPDNLLYFDSFFFEKKTYENNAGKIIFADFTDTTLEVLPMHNANANDADGYITPSTDIVYEGAAQSGKWRVGGSLGELAEYSVEGAGINKKQIANFEELVIRLYSTEETDALNVLFRSTSKNTYTLEKVSITKSGWQEIRIPLSKMLDVKFSIDEWDLFNINKGGWNNPHSNTNVIYFDSIWFEREMPDKLIFADFTDTTLASLPMHNPDANDADGYITPATDIVYEGAAQSGKWRVGGSLGELADYKVSDSGLIKDGLDEFDNIVIRLFSVEETDAMNVLFKSLTKGYTLEKLSITKSGWQEFRIPITKVLGVKFSIDEWDSFVLNKGGWNNPHSRSNVIYLDSIWFEKESTEYLKSSHSSSFESTADGWIGGSIATSPTAEWDSVYKVTAGEVELTIADAAASYMVGSLQIYSGNDFCIKLKDSEVKIAELSNGSLTSDGKCSSLLLGDKRSKWISLRFVADMSGKKLTTYVKDGVSYFKINTQPLETITDGIAIVSTADAYIDDVEIETLAPIYETLNLCTSVDTMTEFLAYAIEKELIQIPTELEKEALGVISEQFLGEKLENDVPVLEELEKAAIAAMCEDSTKELFVYDYDKEYNLSELRELSVIVNKQLTGEELVLYGAAYNSNALTAVIVQPLGKELAAKTKIDVEKPLNISGADSYQLIITDQKTMTPLLDCIEVNLKPTDISSIYYPGWTRKAITFSYDDGNISKDSQALKFINAAGMKATFNLVSSTLSASSAYYKGIYGGHELANHSKWHAASVESDINPDESENYRDLSDVYGEKGFYEYTNPSTGGTQLRVTADIYKKSVTECEEELEKLFGEGSIRGFAYPFSRSNLRSTEVREFIEDHYAYARDSRVITDTTNFAVPADWKNWSCNTTYNNLLSTAEKFEKLADDGTLKMLCAGIHTTDLSRACNDGVHTDYWYQLEDFCALYGNRSEDYWYATNIEIYDYVKATEALEVTERGIENNSPVDVYLKIDGEEIVVRAHSIYR